MADKLDPYRSYGQKLISLFARLLFSGEAHSLAELSRMLGCSKQTVLRLVDDIRRSYGIEIEESFKGRKKFFKIRKASGNIPEAEMTYNEMMVLQMCRAFTEHLLGRRLFEEAAIALGKSRKMLRDRDGTNSGHFASLIPGTIDYTAHHETIHSLVKAMDEKRICKLSYRNVMARRAKSFFAKPFKLFSHRDTIYLHAGLARPPGKPYREPDFDPLLAVHRIRTIDITNRSFTTPDDYDFERDFNQTFGIVKEEAFTVEVEFFGWAANYVSERSWSPGQKIVKRRDGSIKLKFTASSELEIASWVLSFGEHARLIKPADLKANLIQTLAKTRLAYASN
jgi:predicted DNA-binding transcriptional regulator YafY